MSIRCENCIHNGVCYTQEVCNDIEAQLDEFGCEDYKDASRYFLPKFAVGQVLYFLDTIAERVYTAAVYGYSVSAKCETWYYITSDCGNVPARIRESEVDTILSLTEEEAQRKLEALLSSYKVITK